VTRLSLLQTFAGLALSAAVGAAPADPSASRVSEPAAVYAQAQAPDRAEAANPAKTDPAGPGKSDPVADKFRRFQREMAANGASGSASGADKPAAPPESVSVFSVSVKIVFGLLFVLVLAVMAIKLLKRFQGRMLSKSGRPGGDILEVLETCHLGPHQRVVALRMNGEVGIVGVTQQGMSLLTMLKDPAGEIRKQAVGEGNPAAFSENLNKLLERFKRPKRVSDLLDET
jgi:flagellar biogenesis protein FliO